MQGYAYCPQCRRPLTAPSPPYCPYCGASLAPPAGYTGAPPAAYPPSQAPAGYPGPTTPAGPYPQRAPSHGLLIAVVLIVVIIVVVLAIVGAVLLSAPPAGAFTGFRVSGSGCWSGTFANSQGATTDSSCSAKEIPYTCSITLVGQVMKQDSGTWTLTLSIVRNGNVAWTGSTSSAYGIVQGTALC